jgi:hypothetical protein
MGRILASRKLARPREKLAASFGWHSLSSTPAAAQILHQLDLEDVASFHDSGLYFHRRKKQKILGPGWCSEPRKMDKGSVAAAD